MVRTAIYGGLLWLLVAGCSNVAQMHRQYLEGDESQLDKLMEIVARPDYPYATRKNAARILGEIGEPRALPALLRALNEYDQRTTLKAAILKSLGQIGDPVAVESIGKLLDRSLAQPNAELRLAAIPVLGQLGGDKAAFILVNAIGYYDILMLREEQRVPRGVFTGEEQEFPFADSTGRRRGPGADYGLFGEGRAPTTSMFGTEMNFGDMQPYNPTPEERQMAHEALVRIGQPAVTAISEHLSNQRVTPTLRKQLLAIVTQIQEGPQAASAAPETE